MIFNLVSINEYGFQSSYIYLFLIIQLITTLSVFPEVSWSTLAIPRRDAQPIRAVLSADGYTLQYLGSPFIHIAIAAVRDLSDPRIRIDGIHTERK